MAFSAAIGTKLDAVRVMPRTAVVAGQLQPTLNVLGCTAACANAVDPQTPSSRHCAAQEGVPRRRPTSYDVIWRVGAFMHVLDFTWLTDLIYSCCVYQ